MISTCGQPGIQKQPSREQFENIDDSSMSPLKKTGLFIKEITMIKRGNLDETLMISMQTLKISYVFNVTTSETSTFIDVS